MHCYKEQGAEDLHAQTTQMLALARKVLAAMAASLGVDRTYFDQLCHHPIGGPRALHYPPSR